MDKEKHVLYEPQWKLVEIPSQFVKLKLSSTQLNEWRDKTLDIPNIPFP